MEPEGDVEEDAEEYGPRRLEDEDPEYKAKYIQSLADQDGPLESPIDINIAQTVALELPTLEWHNHDLSPKKMKITNTGYTMIWSGKWFKERPHLSGGPFLGNYVFSQAHFHWGKSDMEGSEHKFDGATCPMEMHVVLFKACYLTQESALKEKDGIAVLVYAFKLQTAPNTVVKQFEEEFPKIQKLHTSEKIDPIPISRLVRKFESDYFVYWGSVCTSMCAHFILWVVCREPIGVNSEQVDSFRSLLDANDEPLMGNFRNTQPIGERKVYHISPSGHKHSTLKALS